jgi:hypothetical protein
MIRVCQDAKWSTYVNLIVQITIISYLSVMRYPNLIGQERSRKCDMKMDLTNAFFGWFVVGFHTLVTLSYLIWFKKMERTSLETCFAFVTRIKNRLKIIHTSIVLIVWTCYYIGVSIDYYMNFEPNKCMNNTWEYINFVNMYIILTLTMFPFLAAITILIVSAACLPCVILVKCEEDTNNYQRAPRFDG